MAKKGNAQKTVPVKKANQAPKGFWAEPRHFQYILLVLITTAIVFLPSLGNDFVNWDDDVNILKNQNLAVFDWDHIRKIFTTSVIGGYNPLTTFTFALEKHLFGLNPLVFHFNNLWLHLVCTYFAYRILVGMQLSPVAAALGALLFGIHPMRVESVAWITERKDVLFGAFFLAATFLYIRDCKRGKGPLRTHLWITLLFVLSLFSKIQAVALPLTFLVLDYYFRRPEGWLKLILEKWHYFALSALIGLLGIYFLKENKTLLTDGVVVYSLAQRLLIGCTSFMVYLLKFIFPYKMSPLYPYDKELPWDFYVSPAFVLLTAAWFWWAFRKDIRWVVTGLGIFFVNVVFLLQVLGAGQGLFADRFTYIPYLGLFFMIGYGLDWISSNRKTSYRPALYGAFALLAMYAIMTYRQIGIWKNGETLWTHVLKYHTNATLPYNNRAFYYREQKQYDKALKDYDAALALKMKNVTPGIDKELSGLHNSRGKLFFDKGDMQKSLEEYTLSIRYNPKNAEALVNRGAAYGMSNQLDLALADLNQGIALEPEKDNGYLNRSLVYFTLGRYDMALKDHEKLLTFFPQKPELWYEKGLCYRGLGQEAKAIEDFNQAIQLNPNNGLFYLERGKAYLATGNKGQAAADFRNAQALGAEINPELLQQAQ